MKTYHLYPGQLVSTLLVEPAIILATVQNRLVAPHLLRNKIQRLYQPQPKLLPLLIFRD